MKKIIILLALITFTACSKSKEVDSATESAAQNPAVTQPTQSQLPTGLEPYKLSVSNSSQTLQLNNLPNPLTKLKVRFVPTGGSYRDSTLSKFVNYNSDVSVGVDISYNGKTITTGPIKIGNKTSTVFDFSEHVDKGNSINITLSNFISDVECVAFNKYQGSSPALEPLGAKCGGNVSIETDKINGYLEIETQDTKGI